MIIITYIYHVRVSEKEVNKYKACIYTAVAKVFTLALFKDTVGYVWQQIGQKLCIICLYMKRIQAYRTIYVNVGKTHLLINVECVHERVFILK